MGVTLGNFKQSGKIPVRNEKLTIYDTEHEKHAWHLILFKKEVENVLILPGLFLRERIISSTSAEDTGAKNNELV